MNSRAVDQLAQLLEVEKAALLSGDLEAVAALAAQKEDLAAGFDSTNARALRQISTALERNGALLAAAKQGVHTVLATLQAQRAARTGLSSYDSHGKATVISQPIRGTERRF